MVTPLEALNNFISKDEYDDLGKYHEPDPNHMTPGYGAPNKKSTYPKQTGDFNHDYLSFETQPHSVTFNYKGGVQAVHQNHYTKADHLGQQDYHVNQATKATDPTVASGHKAAAAAHGYQARNMVQPGHDTLTFSRVGSHHGGKYDDAVHLPWVGKANEDSYRDKLLKNPDIIPPKGQRKEDVVDALIKQKLRQKDNNKRANNLLNAEIADPGGGSKAGGDSAMYRLSEFVQKPIEAAEDDSPPIWGKPKDSHIKKANRLIELVDIDPDEVKIDDPPKHKSKKHLAELKFIKQFKDKLDDEDFRDEVSLQDDDLEEPFKRYLRDKELELSSDEKDNLEQIHRDTSTLVHKFKLFYNRQRPHQADDDIDEIENTAGKSPSYPSGHSANAYMMGEYLANKFPEHADEFRNIGKRIGLNRVIVGLHYPSDHIAGVELGQQVVRGIPGMTDVKKSDGFMDELFKYMEHRADLFKDMTQIGTQDILDGVRINKEDPEPVDNIGDLTQAHFDAAGLKMGPDDTWDTDTEQALRDAGMYKPKAKRPIPAVNPEIPTAPPAGDLPNIGTNGLGKLPPNGIYVSQEKPPKDAKIYQTEGGASYWIPDRGHHWSTGLQHGVHKTVETGDDAKKSHGAGWSHNVSFTDILPDGVVPRENALENRAMLRGKIDQDHIPHQTSFSKDEFKNGIETPFELKLPGGLKFGPNAKVTYSRAFKPKSENGRTFVVVDIKSDSRHARHAFYTRTGTGDGGETTKIAGVDVNAGGPTSQGSFVPVDGLTEDGSWYNKTRYSRSHAFAGSNGESLPWHMNRYGNDALKVVARTLDAVGIEGLPGHEDNAKDYEIKSKYEASLDWGQINMLIGSKHSLSNNAGTDSEEFKDAWKHYSKDPGALHIYKNGKPYQHKPEGALSRFMNRLKQKSEDLEKESNPRIPRKKGQPAKSKKHSDLYTDEDPKGTIQGLGFKDDATAKASVKKIRNSGRAHAHKIQAAVAMEQRAKAAGKSSEAGIYRKYIDSMKKKTQAMEKHTEEEHTQEHNASDNYYPKVSVDKSKKSLLDQLNQIESKIETGDYNIKKSEDIFLEKAPKKFNYKDTLSKKQFKELYNDVEGKFKPHLQELGKYIAERMPTASSDQNQQVKNFIDNISTFAPISGKSADDAYDEYVRQWELNLQDVVDLSPVQRNIGAAERDAAKKRVEEAKKRVDTRVEEEVEEEPKAEEAPAEEPKVEETPPEEESEEEEPKEEESKNGNGDDTEDEETGQEEEPDKYTRAHQNRINNIRTAREELNKHLEAFNNVKANAKDPTFEKIGHEEKFKNAKDEYDKAVEKEEKYRASQEKKGIATKNPLNDDDVKDLFGEPTSPEFTDADNAYIERRNELIALAREKGLIDRHYEQNHSDEFDTHYGNPEGSEAELLNQPNDKLQQAFKKLNKPIPKPPDADTGGGTAPKVSNEELRAHEREMVKQGEEISNKYFDKDEDGNFTLKPDLDKHDVLNGMREMSRLMNEEWKGEDNKFNRNEDGSVTSNDNIGKKTENRKQVLGESFNQLVAIGASLRSQGLMQRHGMTEAQSDKAIAAIDEEYRTLGEDFMNPNTDKGKEHLEQVGSKEDFEASNKAHEDYKQAATGRFRTRGDKLRPEVVHSSPLHPNTEHDDLRAEEWQKPMSSADVFDAEQKIKNNDKLSDSQKEQERIRQGLPPEGSTAPTFQGEEEGETVEGVWHRETHRWAKPETLSSGAGSTGHFDTMPDNSFMHLTDKEFNDLQGIKGDDASQFSALANTPKNGIIAHKDKDGNMNFHAGKAGEEDMYANKTIAPVGHGTSSENHARRQADVDNVIETVKNDKQETPFGGKKLYRIDEGGRIKHIGNAEFKPRKTMTNIGQSSSLGRKVSSGLRRFGEQYSANLKNLDALRFINEAKGWRKKNGRKPNININSKLHKHRFSKFSPEQLQEIGKHANLFRSED